MHVPDAPPISITLKQMKVKDLAAAIGAPYEGDGECEVERVAPLEEAGPAGVSFAQGRALKLAGESAAGCLVVPENWAAERTVIRAKDPRAVVARAIAILH